MTAPVDTQHLSFNRPLFNLMADHTACPEDDPRKPGLFSRIQALRCQEAEDALIFSLVLLLTGGDRNKALAELGQGEVAEVEQGPETTQAPRHLTMTVKAVRDEDWRLCPACKSEIVQALENGFQVDGVSTDLMVCLDCHTLYVVFPEGHADFPKDINI